MTKNSTFHIRLYIITLFTFLAGSIKAQSDSTLIVYLNNLGIETSQHNQLKLLKSGEEKFHRPFSSYRKSQTSCSFGIF